MRLGFFLLVHNIGVVQGRVTVMPLCLTDGGLRGTGLGLKEAQVGETAGGDEENAEGVFSLLLLLLCGLPVGMQLVEQLPLGSGPKTNLLHLAGL